MSKFLIAKMSEEILEGQEFEEHNHCASSKSELMGVLIYYRSPNPIVRNLTYAHLT